MCASHSQSGGVLTREVDHRPTAGTSVGPGTPALGTGPWPAVALDGLVVTRVVTEGIFSIFGCLVAGTCRALRGAIGLSSPFVPEEVLSALAEVKIGTYAGSTAIAMMLQNDFFLGDAALQVHVALAWVAEPVTPTHGPEKHVGAALLLSVALHMQVHV